MFESDHDTFDFPPRRETFLARYPRNLKLAVTTVVFALLVLPPAWFHGQPRHHTENVGIASLLKEGGEEKFPVKGGKVEVDIHAPALNDQNDRNVKMAFAPDVRVSEDTAEGTLPRISEDGLRPWQVYARPFDPADKRPRLALVITDLGLSRPITDLVLAQLPPAVTLSFGSQGTVVAAWAARARQEGHEFLLQVPVEPFDYPRSDPGPDTLLTNLPNSENLARLSKILRRTTGYVGVTTIYGSSFTSDSTDFAPILQVLRDRGLMVLDSRAAPRSVVTDMARGANVPVATVSQRLDADLAPDAIAAALQDLERTARQNGRAVGITAATPVMVTQLQAWMKTLPERGIALAPLSAMVQ